ncbi:glycosyltransferase family 2 protein [Candidatus Bathyarchaeota archaeon]|nr:glycosyltransferase family 2 protein [Candidatus Bathyarchaeota archaeon]
MSAHGVDVVVLTKNSERSLRKCLESVYRNIPVNKLIVVDGYSVDSTLDIVREFKRKYGNVVVIQEGGKRGRARQLALEKVETDWFMFVDSDVVLCDGWFAKAAKLIRDKVGAIWGIEIWSVVRNTRFLSLFERITLKIFEKRGGTHDLLVRRKAIEGIRIPEDLHTYEDSYIKKWICRNGYRAVAVYEPYCVHYRPEEVWTVRQSIEFVVNDLKYAVRHPQLILSYAFYTVIVIYQNLRSNIHAAQLRLR